MANRHVYVDESKKAGYLLVASQHTPAQANLLQDTVRGLLLPGQRYLHMKDEKDGRKRTIAAALVASGVQAYVYRAEPRHRNAREARAACLHALVQDQMDARVRVVLDQDDTMVSWDNQKLIEFTRAAGCRDRFHYEHGRARSESLLAVPDAIAWCWAKGGLWRTLVAPSIIAVRDV